MVDITERFELVEKEDRFFDFCLWEYDPLNPPENKFRSINLLLHSFDVMNIPETGFDLVETIRKDMGISNSVWGIKKSGGDIFWEFYFYDYRRRERSRSITGLLNTIKPLVRSDIRINEDLLYFMFSIDIDHDLVSGKKDLDEVHMYIGNPGSDVSSGICYSVTPERSRLENFYFFFDTKKHEEDILAKIASSAHIDSSQIGIDRILIPELKDCRVTVIANKQENDSVYFSGINVDQLIFFLKKMKYPEPVATFVEENRSRLDHLLFDAGFDYRQEGRELEILKSGYYGFF